MKVTSGQIPFAPQDTGRKYPFEEMQVGDYFEVEGYSRERMNRIATAFRNWARYKNRARKAVTDKVGDKIILSRVA